LLAGEGEMDRREKWRLKSFVKKIYFGVRKILEIAHKPGNLQQTLLVIPGNFSFLTLNFLT